MNVTGSSSSGTIVVLTDEYVDYRKGLVDKIAGLLADSEYATLCIAGQQLGIESVCNSIYSLTKTLDVAGVVSLTGTLGQRLDGDQLRAFLHGFSIPTVSVGMLVPDVDSVVVDDVPGMTQLMEHLLRNRDCRRLAFIRGVAGDPYSEEREQIYRTIVEQHGYVVDEELIVEGNFAALDTYREVSALLRKRPDVDTFVAANDIMALSAARAVKVAGFVIPHDIAISGFDDTPDAMKNSPAISTVRQPFDTMARLSVEQLLERIADTWRDTPTTVKTDTSHVYVNSEFVARASTQSIEVQDEPLPVSDYASMSQWLRTAMSGLPTPAMLDLDELCRTLWETMDTGSEAVVECMEGMLERGSSFHDLHWWSNVCDRIEALTVELSAQEQAAKGCMRILFVLANARERLWALGVERDYQLRRQQGLRAAMQLRMSSHSDQAGLLQTMTWWMEALEPKRVFLVQYCNAGTHPDSRATVVHSYLRGTASELESATFATSQLLPDEYRAELNSGILILNPVYAGGQLFGYLLADPTGIEHLDLNSAANSIGNAMRNHFHISQLEYQAERLTAANQSLQKLAHFDSLTNLPNRGHFQAELNRLCNQNTPLALMFMDLDGFKAVNDSAGHDAGDEMLRQVAQRLRNAVASMLGEQGTLARLGGDEFTLIVTGLEKPAAVMGMAQELLHALAHPYQINALTHRISVSIGCAFFPRDASTPVQLVRNADVAMYHAKSLGKNAAVCFPITPGKTGGSLLRACL